jgi:caa(3)-type oxidase subunit IV
MTETHDTHAGHPTDRTYLVVFGALVVFTGVSFWTVSEGFWPLSKQAGYMVVMLVAVCKAVLVAMFFMHLKWDWFKLYFMIVPPLIMGALMICALMPDQTFRHDIKWSWQPYLTEQQHQ